MRVERIVQMFGSGVAVARVKSREDIVWWGDGGILMWWVGMSIVSGLEGGFGDGVGMDVDAA